MHFRRLHAYFLLAALWATSNVACKTSPPTTDPASSPSADTSEAAANPQEPQPQNDAAVPKPPTATITHPFFYKVSGPGGAEGYLLGTMHMGIDAEKELPDYVWAAIKETKHLTLEADVQDPELAKGMMLPKDTNLRKVVGENTWKLLEQSLGKPVAGLLMPMKPAAAAVFLAVKGLPSTPPMDLVLLSKAKSQKQNLHFLETGAFQLELLDNIMTVEFLRDMLENPDQDTSAQMLALYREGNEDKLAALILDPKAWGSSKMTTKHIDAMLFARNKAWIPKLEQVFAQKGGLVAVGAAHLVGERSVIDLLQKKDYIVTRVTK